MLLRDRRTVGSILPVLIVVALLAGCATTQSASTAGGRADSEREAAVGDAADETAPRTAAPGASGEAAAEAARGDTPEGTSPVAALLTNTAPRGGTPVFVGFSPRLYERDEEEAVAVEDAAREAVRYLEVRASAVLIAQEGGGSTGVAEAVQTRIPEERIDSVREGLEVLQSIRHDDGTVVLVSAPELPPVRLPARLSGTSLVSRGTGDPPEWVAEVPSVSGYDVAVGVAERRRRRADSVEAADERALAQIILARSARIRAIGESRRVEDVGTTEQTTRAQEAVDVVEGFYVVSRYIGRRGRYYYSLALAPAPEEGE